MGSCLLAGDTGKHCSQVLELSLHSQKSQDIPPLHQSSPICICSRPGPVLHSQGGEAQRGSERRDSPQSLFPQHRTFQDTHREVNAYSKNCFHLLSDVSASNRLFQNEVETGLKDKLKFIYSWVTKIIVSFAFLPRWPRNSADQKRKNLYQVYKVETPELEKVLEKGQRHSRKTSSKSVGGAQPCAVSSGKRQKEILYRYLPKSAHQHMSTGSQISDPAPVPDDPQVPDLGVLVGPPERWAEQVTVPRWCPGCAACAFSEDWSVAQMI